MKPNKDEYLKAKAIVLLYESGEKTPVKDWIKINNPSAKIQRALSHFEFMEDVTKESFMAVPFMGKKAWYDFNELLLGK